MSRLPLRVHRPQPRFRTAQIGDHAEVGTHGGSPVGVIPCITHRDPVTLHRLPSPVQQASQIAAMGEHVPQMDPMGPSPSPG